MRTLFFIVLLFFAVQGRAAIYNWINAPDGLSWTSVDVVNVAWQISTNGSTADGTYNVYGKTIVNGSTSSEFLFGTVTVTGGLASPGSLTVPLSTRSGNFHQSTGVPPWAFVPAYSTDDHITACSFLLTSVKKPDGTLISYNADPFSGNFNLYFSRTGYAKPPPNTYDVSLSLTINGTATLTPPDPNSTKPTDPIAGDVPTIDSEDQDDNNDDGGDDCLCLTCEPGMLRYGAHYLLASLYLVDRPLSYVPAFGPKANFRLSYSHRDVQPVMPVTAAANGFSNLGPQWTCNWFSYVTDDPTDTSQAAIYVRGGGTESYGQFDAVTQSYAPDPKSRAVLLRTTGASYEKQFPDGCRYEYEQPDGSVAFPRRLFLTKVIDPHGNTTILTYDGFNRLMKVTDATGKDTTLSYENPGWYYLVTKITDPFGRSAQIQYYPDGRLLSITDAIGLTSTVFYEAGDNFINQLTTPYGTSTFSHGEDATGQWVEMVDALGSHERVETRDYAPGILPNEASAPAGFFNAELNVRNTFYWDKKAEMVAPGDFTKAKITHWLKNPDGTTTSETPDSEKAALESRVWYTYADQPAPNVMGSSTLPSQVARILDDGSLQLSEFTYNEWGHLLQSVDPIGRTTTCTYFANDIDLHYVYQTSNGIHDLLSTMDNYVGHQPQTTTDASGQTTNVTYTPYGQVDTLTNAKGEVTKNVYNTDPTKPGFGRLYTSTRAFGTASAATQTLTYDSFDRVLTTTDEDNYTLTMSYDAVGGPLNSLDRLTKVLHPDGTSEVTVYNLLDAEDHYDRLGRLTHTPHDALQRVSSVTDPENRTVQYGWCMCGALDKITDANGVVTQWTRDIEKRPTQKTIHGVTVATTTYENTTSRVKSIQDGNSQTQSFTYYADNHVSTVTYLNATSTPIPALSVGYIYDQNYDRISSMTDGLGTTNYSYNPITNPPVALGEGKLSAVSGPSGNQAVGYTISYAYDELGRRLGRTVIGAANGGALAANATAVAYDALGRINPTNTNVLGSFGHFYVGNTGRVDHLTYPNSQEVDFGYDVNPTHDRELLEIKNLDPMGGVLSKFDYTHAATGRIDTWTQFNPDLTNPQKYTFGYDGADQLRTANLTDTGSGATVSLSAYSYDLAGNRLTAQSDNNVSTTTYNFPFQLKLDPGGLMYFSGALNENVTLTIGGQVATVTANPGGVPGQAYLFSGWATVAAGANTLPIVATEADVVPGLNPKVTSQHIQLTLGSFATKTVSLDNIGNMANDFQSSSFTWDAAHRLATITNSPITTTLTYDGLGRRVKIVQSQGGTVTSERHYIWDEMALLEERDGSNQVTKRYFGEGEQRVSGSTATNYFYTRDHLGSLREMTDAGGTVHARYSYDVWGQRTKQSGDLDADFGFTGHFYHSPSQLYLAPFRVYSAGLGRWLSRDPVGERGGTNLYAYVQNDPIDLVDPLGLRDIYVAIWNRKLPSVGHAMALETDGSTIVSQFPDPHGMNGVNTTFDYSKTLAAEGRLPDQVYKVFVPDDAAFDKAAADHLGRPTWNWAPSGDGTQTNCSTAVWDALQNGGVPVDFNVWPGNLGDNLSDLSQTPPTSGQQWSVTPVTPSYIPINPFLFP